MAKNPPPDMDRVTFFRGAIMAVLFAPTKYILVQVNQRNASNSGTMNMNKTGYSIDLTIQPPPEKAAQM